MKILFTLILSVHGAIHVMGFLKAFRFAEFSQLKLEISKLAGIIWLFACFLLLCSAVLFLIDSPKWFLPASAGVIISCILIFSAWGDARYGMIANILILTGIIIAAGDYQFSGKYRKEVQNSYKMETESAEEILSEADLQKLPEPVSKYIRYSGSVGKPKVQSFRVSFEGKIRSSEESGWMSFTTEQYNFLEPATRLFYMKAKMKGLPFNGFHFYRETESFMDIRLLSLFTVQFAEGMEMGVSETVTFFNDMCCLAPATLIDPRIKWSESDSSKVLAEFTVKDVTIAAWLYFNEEGQMINFVSENRYAYSKDGNMNKYPWSTPLTDFREINGRKVGGYADLIYHYPEKDFTYGSFSLKDIQYNPKIGATK